MKYEIKKYNKTGVLQDNKDGTLSQFVNVTIGVCDCEHDDISTEKTVEVIISDELSFKQVDLRISIFLDNWLEENYPCTDIIENNEENV